MAASDRAYRAYLAIVKNRDGCKSVLYVIRYTRKYGFQRRVLRKDFKLTQALTALITTRTDYRAKRALASALENGWSGFLGQRGAQHCMCAQPFRNLQLMAPGPCLFMTAYVTGTSMHVNA